MKKKIIIVSIVVLLLVLLVPIPKHFKDGGTVEYQALIYKVTKYNKFLVKEENQAEGRLTGYQIELFGNTIYSKTEEKYEEVNLGKIVKLNGQLYYETGKVSEITGRCGVGVEPLNSCIDSNIIPRQDKEANFPCEGVMYQMAEEGTVDVFINNQWWVFKTK